MKIKDDNSKVSYHKYYERFKNYKVLTCLFFLLLLSGVMILLGGHLHKEGIFGEVLKPMIQENVRIPFNYLAGLATSPERIVIDIKHKDYQKLAYKRKIALSEGVLHPQPDDYVPAKIRVNGETVKVKLRLKGDLADHWSRDFNWSLRVKAKKGKTVLGMKNFSVQHPRTRGFMNDWVLHRMLKRLGFITLRYDFADVVVNGRHLGIQAIEEHFEKLLLENNKRIEAPIIRIKDHLLWYLVEPGVGFASDDLDELYSSSPIDAFNTSVTTNDRRLLANFKKAKNLLESFRRGYLPTHEVFDVEKTAMIFAVIDLFGYSHSTAYSNIRFYYNPVTSRLVPIGYDNTFIKNAEKIQGQGKRLRLSAEDNDPRLNWYRTFFEDKVFFEKYIHALESLLNRDFLDTFFSAEADDFERSMHVLYRSFPGYSFSKERATLYKNQERIRKIISPREGIQAYFNKYDSDRGIVNIEIGNIQQLPVEIINVTYQGHVFELLDNSNIVQTKEPFRPVEFVKMRFRTGSGINWNDDVARHLVVNYRILGASEIKSISVFPWSYLDEDFLETDFIRKKPNYDDFDFLDVSDRTISIKKGDWSLDRNLIIPEGFRFVCREGTTITLSNNAKILSYSPVEFIGTEASPIVISAEGSTGQGLVVIKAGKRSALKNVVFNNISPPSQAGWELSAAVNFYESDVDINNTVFSRCHREACLEIIRSDFTLDKARFDAAAGNAINIVFADGAISDSIISGVGENGIYVKGGNVVAENIKIDRIVKKAVVITDRSKVSLKRLSVIGAKTAFSVANSSEATLEDVEVVGADTAFNVFNDKTYYNGARMTIKSISYDRVKDLYHVDDKSELTINGIRYQSDIN